MPDSTAQADSGTTLMLAVAWLFVGIPLAWGVFNTVKTALPLFQ
jgi:hypothetical protein